MPKANQAALSALLLLASCGRRSEPAPPMVDIQSVNPGIRLDIRYATANNFTRQPVYDAARCYLIADAAGRLSDVQMELEKQGLGLKVFDCYRPLSVQKKFWALVPDERYVASPAKGSRHNRGAAVDLTLVAADGSDLRMPTDFDDFTVKAHRGYSDLPEEARRNRATLQSAMEKNGFVGLPTEWWHFDYKGWEKHPVLDIPLSRLGR